jgi:hypothetical protein
LSFLSLTAEFRKASRKSGVFDKPHFPIEKVVENINMHLRGLEVQLQQKSSPQQRLF